MTNFADTMIRGLNTILGLVLVVVHTNSAPVKMRDECDCGLIKNRIDEMKLSVDTHQTNHDRLAGSLLVQQRALDKVIKDGQRHTQFVDTMLEKNTEDVFFLGEKYESLYGDIDILANITQQVQQDNGAVQDKVKAYTSQASYLQQEIEQIKTFLSSFDKRYRSLEQLHENKVSEREARTFPKLVRRVKEIKRKSDHMGRILNSARGQTWAMKKNVHSLEASQEKLKRDINSMRQISQDNMDIISNQFLRIQEKIDKSLVQFNRTMDERIKQMKEDVFNEVMSTAVQMLVLKPAKYILEQGWYPQIHHQESDKD